MTDSRPRKFPRSLLITLATIYAALCALLYFTQDLQVFPAPQEFPKLTPMTLGIPFEDLHIPVNGSEQIHAWWLPATNPSKKVFLSFHGNGYVLESNITRESESKSDLFSLHEIGINVLAIDYRGYGLSSPGPTNEKRVYEDARAAFNYLTVQRGVPARDIIVAGYSIGTGPATELAKEHPDAGGLLLVSPFTSTPDIVKTHSVFWWAWPFPYRLLSHNKFDNLSKINSVHIPVFIAVGTADTLTIPSMAQALYQRANDPKQLYQVPGAGHNEIWTVGGQALRDQIAAFVQTTH
jgi:uncharacterized protein